MKLLNFAEYSLEKAGLDFGDVRTWAQPSFGAQGGVFWERSASTTQLMDEGPFTASFTRDINEIDWYNRVALREDDWILIGVNGWALVIRKLPRVCSKCGQNHVPSVFKPKPAVVTVYDKSGKPLGTVKPENIQSIAHHA